MGDLHAFFFLQYVRNVRVDFDQNAKESDRDVTRENRTSRHSASLQPRCQGQPSFNMTPREQHTIYNRAFVRTRQSPCYLLSLNALATSLVAAFCQVRAELCRARSLQGFMRTPSVPNSVSPISWKHQSMCNR